MEDERLGNDPEMTAGVCERGQAVPTGSDPPRARHMTDARHRAPRQVPRGLVHACAAPQAAEKPDLDSMDIKHFGLGEILLLRCTV